MLAKLTEGGQVVSVFKPRPPPDDKGGAAMALDKYGYIWILCAGV